ncbi:MAG: dihydroorotate dehydrogenase electron transfer subunit [Planctomycetota bacterium]|jgi:dihydroorotate dehydrogenase electron transfer subunit
MAAPPSDTQVETAKVHSFRPVGDDAFVLGVTLSGPIAPLTAGRFYMLRRNDDLSPAIPRPFSVYRKGETGAVEFLIKTFGKGTKALAATRVGEEVSLIGPLGNGWPAWQADGTAKWFVGGGIGSAPFYMAIEQALTAGVPADQITFVYGGRSKGFLYDLDLFRALGVKVVAATDDGSEGFHGNVVQACEHMLEGHSGPVQIYTCGPDPMMKAVVAFARRNDFESWISLETYMGCGVGICNGCAVGTEADGPLGDWPVAKCCVDGPVFSAAAVQF